MIGDLIIWFALAIVTFYLEGLNNLRAAVTVLGDRVTAVEAKLSTIVSDADVQAEADKIVALNGRLAVALVPPATTT